MAPKNSSSRMNSGGVAGIVVILLTLGIVSIVLLGRTLGSSMGWTPSGTESLLLASFALVGVSSGAMLVAGSRLSNSARSTTSQRVGSIIQILGLALVVLLVLGYIAAQVIVLGAQLR